MLLAIPRLRWTDTEIATRMSLHRSLARLSSAAVRHDDSFYYQDLAERAGRIDSETGLQGLWKEIKAALPRQQNRRKSNTRCKQPSLQRMTKHFTTLEAGELVHFGELAKQCNIEQQSRHKVVVSVADATTLPDRLTVERLCMKVQPNKAPGLDGIQPKVVKDHAGVVGCALSELFLKMWLLRSEPVHWKGGLLYPLWKGSGPWDDPSKFRGIVLLNVLGKRWHSLLRQKILPHAEAQKLPSQFGGFPGQQPGFATCAVRTFANICKHAELNDACIYLDLRSAFHHLIRQLAIEMPDPALPLPVRRALEADGLPVADIEARAADPNQYGKLPLPEHLNALVADLHQFTWFTLQGSDRPVWTHRGTRPGSPYADLGFNTFMGQLMVGIREILFEHRILEEACDIAGLEPIVVGWVDDIAIPLAATTPGDLCSLIQSVTEQVLSLMCKAGFQINMDRGKTECIATFRGRGAPAMRSQIFVEEQGTLPVFEADGQSPESKSLHLVGKYVHLGTCMAQEQNFDLEIRRRIGIAQTAFRMLARPVFRNKRISCASRLQLLESLICTKLFYNTGPWPALRPGRLRKLEQTVIRWQRQIIGNGFWTDNCATDIDLQRQWLLPTIGVRFAMCRLRFGLAAFRASHSTTWQLLRIEASTCSSSWFELLAAALRWFGDILPTWAPETVDLINLTFDQVELWFKGPLCPTKAALRRCLRKHLAQEQLIGEVRDNYGRMIQLFTQKGRLIPTPPDPAPRNGRFTCEECAAVFPRAQQLQAHRWSKHGLISIERQYADGATCRACGCHFWTAQRVQQHLRLSRRKENGCLERLFRHVLPHDVPLPVALPAHLQHIRRLPPIQVAEPMSIHGPTLHEEQMQEAWEQWCVQWEELGLPLEPPKHIVDFSVQLLSSSVQEKVRRGSREQGDFFEGWVLAMHELKVKTECGDHMAEWMFLLWYQSTLPDLTGEWDDPEAIQDADTEAYELIAPSTVFALWQCRSASSRLPPTLPSTPGDGVAAPRVDRSHEIWTAFGHQDEFLEEVLRPPLQQPAAQHPIGCIRGLKGEKILVVVHLFSGRRREGDVHEWLSVLASNYLQGWEVWVLSFDTAVDAEKGNLLGKNFEMLLKIATMGMIAGGIGGPPCETFSAARHLPPPEGCKVRWPRPLRSEERLWGVAGLSQRELRQLRIGSLLYFNCNLVEFAIALNGGVSMEEHPASSGVSGQASSWQSSLNRHFAAHVENTFPIRINQWRFGAASVKPTVLRVMGAPTARFEIWKHVDPNAKKPPPQAQLRGINSNTGEFRTAGAKEYPAGLSKAIAHVMLNELRNKVASGCLQFWDWNSYPQEIEWLHEMHVYSAQIRADAVRLPDFQG